MSEGRIEAPYAAIQFQEVGKTYHFSRDNIPELQVGDYVIVNTSRGRELGRVVDLVSETPKSQTGGIKAVERIASPVDLVLRRMWRQRELEALIDCREKAAELDVRGVKFARAEFAYDGSRLSIFYSSEGDEKVDLKKLLKRLQRTHRDTSIDLRQVGPRDVAKVFCGMGACGMNERCCSMFLTEFSPISIKMAKAQGISLNPQEITGMCGRLRCCLKYEYEQYVEARKGMPKRNKRVITPQGEGKVIDLNPLLGIVTVLLTDGRRAEFGREDIQPYTELKALQDKAKSGDGREVRE
ncbi:MAG: stage 0 sporulation protein [Anaerolineales bacterium]|nr:stage 0 sporulation protein [Anaerolineales bacterium]